MAKEEKPDWKQLVENRLVSLNLPPSDEQEIVAELATHMEDAYEEARARGLNANASFELAMQEIHDHHVLAANLRRSKSKEDSMNLRTKSLWLPALASLFASSLLLFILTELSMQPKLLVRLNSGVAQWLYALWIVAQIACGALGAFLSRRVGGSRIARLIAGTFPAIVMLASCAIVIPFSALLQHNDFIFHNPGRLWIGAFFWAIVPGIMLLLGAAPFLKESRAQNA